MNIRPAFVIGNGESRLKLDLNELKPIGLTVGCNALYRDFNCDILSCCDQRMVQEAKEVYKNPIYTRSNWSQSTNCVAYPDLPYRGEKREDDPWHWNSGPHAINIACKSSRAGWMGQRANLIFLIGFDLTTDKQTKVNNVYKDTENYSSSDSKPVDPKYWHYQIAKMFESYPKCSFVWVTPNSIKTPDMWTHENFFREPLVNFQNFIDHCEEKKGTLDIFFKTI